jgi:hypothetical protein
MDPVQIDEVALQREKHRAARRDRPVPGFPTMTVGELADQVQAATTEVGTTEDVIRFLHSAGHSSETIESVLRSLDLDPAEEPADNDAACAGLDTSPGRQRLRMLARLESLLLQE